MYELWKPVVGYEGKYEVSNLGNLRSKASLKMPASFIDKDGYIIVRLHKYIDKKNTCRSKRLHRLVAEAFIENPNNYPIVNHKDEVKTNNCVENLEWCTNKYNIRYSYERHEEYREQSRINGRKTGHKTPVRVYLNGKMIGEFETQVECHEKLKIDKRRIQWCLKTGKQNRKGYKIEYVKGVGFSYEHKTGSKNIQ